MSHEELVEKAMNRTGVKMAYDDTKEEFAILEEKIKANIQNSEVRANPQPHDTASIVEDMFCKGCGWPVIHVCCNDGMSKEPWGTDWWGYCSNKSCKHHAGEEWWDADPDFTFRI